MKKKQKRIHLAIGWILITVLARLLFPDKNIALQAEQPHLGQLSTRTIVSTLKFDIPKSKQEIEVERQRAEEKVNAIFGYNTDETNRISEDLKQYLQKLAKSARTAATPKATTPCSARCSRPAASTRPSSSASPSPPSAR